MYFKQRRSTHGLSYSRNFIFPVRSSWNSVSPSTSWSLSLTPALYEGSVCYLLRLKLLNLTFKLTSLQVTWLKFFLASSSADSPRFQKPRNTCTGLLNHHNCTEASPEGGDCRPWWKHEYWPPGPDQKRNACTDKLTEYVSAHVDC
jgi:hypothetical protein